MTIFPTDRPSPISRHKFLMVLPPFLASPLVPNASLTVGDLPDTLNLALPRFVVLEQDRLYCFVIGVMRYITIMLLLLFRAASAYDISESHRMMCNNNYCRRAVGIITTHML